MNNKHKNLNLPESILIKKQLKTFTKKNVLIDGEKVDITATVRYDDQCGNGHNSFSITGKVYSANRPHTDSNMISCGCIHNYIEKAFPELAHLIKWHLVSSDGPMHYIENTTYHAREHGPTDGYLYFEDKANGISKHCVKAGKIDKLQEISSTNTSLYFVEIDEESEKIANLEAARSCAVWPDATLEQLQNKDALLERLPALMHKFKKDVESLGFTY